MCTSKKYWIIKRNTKRIAALMIAAFLFLTFLIVPIHVFAANQSSMTDIRVGLKSMYADIGSVKINNQKIGIGYCIQNRYSSDTEFTSSTGFSFQPAKGYYYEVNKTYPSYQSAKKTADIIKGLGVDAYPATVYRNEWRLYIGGTTDQAGYNKIYEKIEGKFSFTYKKLNSDNKHRILVTGENDAFVIDGGVKSAYPQIKALTSNSKNVAVLDLGSRQYRGRIEIGRYGTDKLTCINIINIESYLYGVVPSEMVSSWNKEALKAQALCARSFALSKVTYSADSNVSRAYQIDDTTNSQVYKGYLSETSSTNQAVNSTKGEVVTYKGEIIPTYFFSTSGGSTENSADVWGKAYPYLKRTPDQYEFEPEKEPWIVKMKDTEIASKVTANGKGAGIGTIKDVTARITTGSGRVYSLKVTGQNSSAILQTSSIRTVLGFPSTKFKVIKYGDTPDQVSVKSASGEGNIQISDTYIASGKGVNRADIGMEQFIVKGAANSENYPVKAPENPNTYYFAGMGYGHGVGMSQSGAKGMADAGYTYDEIIKYYYTGCEIVKMN